GDVLPNAMLDRIAALRHSMQWLRTEFRKRIPEAIVKLDEALRELQGYIRSGGETTSKTVTHEAVTGETRVTYTQEERLLENGPLPVRSARGGWEQNPAKDPKTIAKYYKHEPGYPDLMARIDDEGSYSDIASFSGRIRNEKLRGGRKIFRLFGPEGDTFDISVGETKAGGKFWSLGDEPKTAQEWREQCAVLDEWNRDGFIVTGTIPEGQTINAATGVVSEQAGRKLAGQYLPGGAQQAVIDFDRETQTELIKLGQQASHTGKAIAWTDPKTGMVFELRGTFWPIDEVNGKWGYADLPDPAEVRTQPLDSHEIADKKYKDNAP
ncbi:MAG: hypothetical protein P8015_21055, partial [Acidihalobacter sp.]